MTLLGLTLQQGCACQAKRSGNTPAEAEQQRRFIACLVTLTAPMMTVCLETLRGMAVMQEAQLTQLPAKPPIRSACTTCQAMCMSGAMIGGEVRITVQAQLRTQQDLRQVRSACFAAAIGSASPPPPTTAARRPVTPAFPTAAASKSASVSRGLRSSLYLADSAESASIFFCHFTFTFLCQNCGSSFGKKSRLKLCARNRLVATN